MRKNKKLWIWLAVIAAGVLVYMNWDKIKTSPKLAPLMAKLGMGDKTTSKGIHGIDLDLDTVAESVENYDENIA